MSESLLRSAASYLPNGQLTVTDVIDGLRMHVKVLQCEVFGYLNVEGDLTVLLMPIVVSPSPLQVCIRARPYNTYAKKAYFNSPPVCTPDRKSVV